MKQDSGLLFSFIVVEKRIKAAVLKLGVATLCRVAKLCPEKQNIIFVGKFLLLSTLLYNKSTNRVASYKKRVA